MEQKNLFVSDHPLIAHKISKLRSVTTKPKQFRDLIEEISTLLVYEATRDFALKDLTVTTPQQECQGKEVADSVALVPILRAGLGMLTASLDVLPFATVWHLGLYRDEETFQPCQYYNKMKEERVTEVDTVLVLDPMLATGGSVSAAVKILKDKGAKNVKVLAILGVPEGVKRIHSEFPDVPIYLAGMDEKLNEHAFIVPGLGDAGDRQYNTA